MGTGEIAAHDDWEDDDEGSVEDLLAEFEAGKKGLTTDGTWDGSILVVYRLDADGCSASSPDLPWLEARGSGLSATRREVRAMLAPYIDDLTVLDERVAPLEQSTSGLGVVATFRPSAAVSIVAPTTSAACAFRSTSLPEPLKHTELGRMVP